MGQSFQTGNEEVDRQFGDSIPIPSLMLIEGGHGSGKSAMVALFMKGLLDSDKKVLCITENTVKEYIENMKAITYNFSHAFLQNKLTIMPLHVYGIKWNREQSAYLLPVISKYMSNSFKEANAVIIDSLSLLTVFSDATKILDFFLQLGATNVGGRDVKTCKIQKLIGAEVKPESSFAFEVDQVFGIKVRSEERR